jgi:uncharacterized protein DUF4185
MARSLSWAVGLLLATSSCAPESAPPSASGASWPEADRLFHQDPLWLGADGAYSVDLGAGRSLWLFGDTFVATSTASLRTGSSMPRNTIAIQEGRDPASATMRFFWGTNAAGKPASFFADGSDTWVWPGHGLRLPGGPLIVFLSVERATPGQGLGFASAGWRIAIIDNPDDDPSTWAPRYLDPAPAPFDAIVGSAVARDGDYLVALAPRNDTHAGQLARFVPTDLLAGVVAPEWWAGSARGWVAEADLGGPPAIVIDDAGSEASLHEVATSSAWVHVASRGFGKTTIALRRAPAITGPWSPPVDAFTPPESNGPRPFVYAAKAHPELTTGDPADLVATYATNSFTFADLLTGEGMESLYWPRFVRLALH